MKIKIGNYYKVLDSKRIELAIDKFKKAYPELSELEQTCIDRIYFNEEMNPTIQVKKALKSLVDNGVIAAIYD